MVSESTQPKGASYIVGVSTKIAWSLMETKMVERMLAGMNLVPNDRGIQAIIHMAPRHLQMPSPNSPNQRVVNTGCLSPV
jgi:hypothetical protein